jgi:hypothetical protein
MIHSKMPALTEFARRQAAAGKWNQFGLMRDDLIAEGTSILYLSISIDLSLSVRLCILIVCRE